jgi:hypothetical protein
MHVMKLLLFLMLLLPPQVPNPKNDPTGVWLAGTGSQYQIQLSGSSMHIKIVPGSNPKFLQYEMELMNEKEVNTYWGKGFFVAKMETGKECRLTTDWRVVVVSPDRIIGTTTRVSADGKTCEVKETTQVPLDLKRQK